MASLKTRRFADVDQLKAISPNRLYRLLESYADYLSSRNVPLPPDEVGEVDLQALSRLLSVPDETLPPDLVDALYLISEMATDAGMDALLEAIRLRGLQLEAGPDATPADLALEVYLTWPELLQQEHAETLIARPRSFTNFVGRHGNTVEMGREDAMTLEAVETELDDWFFANRRGRGCKVLRVDRGGKVWLLIRHGLPVKREGALHQGQSRSVFYRPEKHDVVVYDSERDDLGINARTKKEMALYRMLIGCYLFDDPEHFSGGGKYTLDPLKHDGAAALVCSDVQGIEWVKLVEVGVWEGGEHDYRNVHNGTDALAAMASKGRSLSPACRLTHAVFAVKFAHAPRPRKVTIRPDSIAEYTRDEDSELFELWLLLRGFIRRIETPHGAPAGPALVDA